MTQIDIVDLNKAYGDVQVLQDITVSVGDGEFVVLVGPSGCGKSTLLRIIAGLETISGGVVAYDGHVVNGLPPQQRNVAMVFQNYALYPHMTVFDNMAFGLRRQGLDKAAITARVTAAAQTLGLTPFLKRRPRALSGGQRQRVAMGRAIVREPVAFLFDEPLSNLDAKLRVQMRSEIRRLQKQLRATAVYVTHDQIEAMTMGDRIVVMNHGRIEQIGAPLALYQQPANRFVAGFIGSPPMNFLPVTVDGGALVLEDGQRLRPAARGLPADWQGRRLIAGLRPEQLMAHPDRNGLPTLSLTGRVAQFDHLGQETEVFLSLGAGEITARLDEVLVPAEGQPLEVRLRERDLHLFDGETEQRLVWDTPARASLAAV